MRAPWNIRVGLALGGGAARGLAHAGVLRALVREEIPIDVIAGTSMGAIIGAAYAATTDVELLQGRIRETLTSERFRRSRLSFLKESKERRGGVLYSVANLVKRGIVYGVSNWKRSFLSAEAFAADIESIVPDIAVENTRVPFGAVTLDLEEGEEVVLCHGSLRRAVAASSAIPGVLPPVHLGGRVLIDGGWIDKVPVLPAFRLGADVVIAVDISADVYDTRTTARGSRFSFAPMRSRTPRWSASPARSRTWSSNRTSRTSTGRTSDSTNGASRPGTPPRPRPCRRSARRCGPHASVRSSARASASDWPRSTSNRTT